MKTQSTSRVAYVSQFPDMVGGGEHSLMELMSHLPDSITGELIVPSDGELSRSARKVGLPVNHLPMPKLGIKSIQALWQWRKWMLHHSYDVVHANQSRAAFYAGLATLGLKTKMVFHCRIAATDGIMDIILRQLSDAIICNSRAVANRFSDYSGILKVIYNGVVRKYANSDTAPTLPEDATLLLFVGRFSSEKQPQIALQIFEQIADKYPELHFAMLGGDDPQDSLYSDSIRERAVSSPFANRIHLPGAVKNVTDWYRRASALVLTSKHEGFGRVLVEAMAEGVVPVAFSVGGVPEVFVHGEQGFLVEPDDIDAMRQSVEQLLDNEALRNSLAENGRERAGSFSIENHVAAVEALYQELQRDE